MYFGRIKHPSSLYRSGCRELKEEDDEPPPSASAECTADASYVADENSFLEQHDTYSVSAKSYIHRISKSGNAHRVSAENNHETYFLCKIRISSTQQHNTYPLKNGYKIIPRGTESPSFLHVQCSTSQCGWYRLISFTADSLYHRHHVTLPYHFFRGIKMMESTQ